MSCSLNPLKGCIGDYVGEYLRGDSGDTRTVQAKAHIMFFLKFWGMPKAPTVTILNSLL